MSNRGPNAFPEQARRAQSNLSYLDFIRVVRKLWNEAHPEIPLVTSISSLAAQFPAITYKLEMRKTMQNEAKPRVREQIAEDGKQWLVTGQRFQNVVKFEVLDEVHANWSSNKIPLVEEIVEIFEDFMLEITPVLKYMGASEFVYARRMADEAEDRGSQPTIIKRSVSYMLTTEKVIAVEVDTIEHMILDARIAISQDYSDPEPDDIGATPNFGPLFTDQESSP